MPNNEVPKVFKTEPEAQAREKNTTSALRVVAVVALLAVAVGAVVWLI